MFCARSVCVRESLLALSGPLQASLLSFAVPIRICKKKCSRAPLSNEVYVVPVPHFATSSSSKCKMLLSSYYENSIPSFSVFHLLYARIYMLRLVALLLSVHYYIQYQLMLLDFHMHAHACVALLISLDTTTSSIRIQYYNNNSS